MVHLLSEFRSITNGDFEAPLTLGQNDPVRGPFSFSAVGWDINNGRAGTYLPTTVAYGSGVADGRIGWSNGGTFSQLTSSTFQAGYAYSLSVDIGYRLDAGSPSGGIGIFAGDISNVIASLSLSSQGRGVFYTGQVSATDADYRSFIGQNIGVFMVANGVQINFDNVGVQ